MTTLDATLAASTISDKSPYKSADTPARSPDRTASSLVCLLGGVALASAAAGGAATLALERLIVWMDPPRVVSAPAKVAPAVAPEPPAQPAAHDVLDDRAEPPLEPPPAS